MSYYSDYIDKKGDVHMMIARIVLSIIAGSIVGFVAILLGESLGMLITAGLAAVLVAGIVVGVTSGLKGLNWLLAIIFGVATFFLYGALLGHLNENTDSEIGFLIPVFAPYVIAVFLYSLAKADDN